MKVFVRLVMLLAAVALAAALVGWHALMVFGSGNSLNTALNNGPAYQQAAATLQSRLKADVHGGTEPQIETVLNTAIDQAVTAKLVQDMAHPVLQQLANWLRAGDSPLPNLSISTAQLKSALMTQAQAAAAAQGQTAAQLNFEITRIVPDTVSITGDDAAATQALQDNLQTVQQNYAQLRRTVAILLLSAGLLLASLVLLSLRHRRAMLRRPGVALLGTAALLVLLAYPGRYLLQQTLLAGRGSVLAVAVKSISQYILRTLTPLAIVVAIVGGLLIIGSFVLPKPAEHLPNI